MRRHLCCVLLVACGGTQSSNPSNTTTETHVVPAPTPTLQLKSIVDHEGAAYAVWLQHERESGIDTADHCCGLSYDGNKYDAPRATCAVNDECGPTRAAVYPGLANDPLCGEHRRCVPLPAARIVVEDDTEVTAVDANEASVPVGGADTEHALVDVGREGFVVVTVAGKTQLVAVDYGARYTIVVRSGAIERVTRDL
jgi:hypothetical protein